MSPKLSAWGLVLLGTVQVCPGMEACVITQTEAEAVLGAGVGAERPQPGYRGAEVCWYVAPADQSLRFELHRGGRRAYEAYRKAFDRVPGSKARLIKGVGDEAVLHSGQLTVLSGDAFFVIAIGKVMQDSDRLDTSIALARKVLQRLAWRTHSCLPRRDSSRRLRILTTRVETSTDRAA